MLMEVKGLEQSDCKRRQLVIGRHKGLSFIRPSVIPVATTCGDDKTTYGTTLGLGLRTSASDIALSQVAAMTTVMVPVDPDQLLVGSVQLVPYLHF